MAKGGNGPSRRQPCGPATSRPPSSTALVSSSTQSGPPSVLATICAVTSGGSGRPATRSAKVSTSAGARRSSAMLVTCERPVQGASYSGRKVKSANTGKARTRSTVRSSTSSEVASAQWTSLYRAANRDADAHAVLALAVEGFPPTRQLPELTEAQTLLAALNP